MTRLTFCGVIEGEVAVRDGESPDEAIARAEADLNAVLSKHCKRYSRIALGERGMGPIVGLEDGVAEATR